MSRPHTGIAALTFVQESVLDVIHSRRFPETGSRGEGGMMAGCGTQVNTLVTEMLTGRYSQVLQGKAGSPGRRERWAGSHREFS